MPTPQQEANVYHAFSNTGEVAVKVYKTSVLTFKDRDRCPPTKVP